MAHAHQRDQDHDKTGQESALDRPRPFRDDLVTRGEQLVDDGGADPSGGPGDENVHVNSCSVNDVGD
jgi:hypothetical protein